MKKIVFCSLAVACALPLFAKVETTAPFCALRFGYRYTQPDKWPEMRAALAKTRAAFDAVWFSTGVSFPPLAWHEEHARQYAAAAAATAAIWHQPEAQPVRLPIERTDGVVRVRLPRLGAWDCAWLSFE